MATTTSDPAVFWRDYEIEHGEKVLAYSLGCYNSGWDEFKGPLWGLLIATDGGFRFHHFPHEGWINALSRITGGGGAPPEEKTLFIPRSRLLKVELRLEPSLLRRILSPHPPIFALRYTKTDGSEGLLLADTDKTAQPVVNALGGLLAE